jgi:hypothetical protein
VISLVLDGIIDLKSNFMFRLTATFSRAKTDNAAIERDEPAQQIWVTLPDGSRAQWPKHLTTPLDVARNISRRLADASVAAKVHQASNYLCGRCS